MLLPKRTRKNPNLGYNPRPDFQEPERWYNKTAAKIVDKILYCFCTD